MSIVQEEVDVDKVINKLLDKQCINNTTQGPKRR